MELEVRQIVGHLSSPGSIKGRIEGLKTLSPSELKYASHEVYRGEYTITPKLEERQVLPTKQKVMTDDVTVLEIPYFENNTSGTEGKTIYLCTTEGI